MKAIYLYADDVNEFNCSRWRCHLLSNAINAAHEANPKGFPHTASMYDLRTSLNIDHPRVQDKIGRGDVIVVQRNAIFEEVWRAMDYWRALGKIVLVDLDDGYAIIPPSNPAYPFWIANSLEFEPDPCERLKEGLQHADGLVAPSHVLLKDWEHIVPGYYWPNYPALADYQDLDLKPLGGPDVQWDYIFEEGQLPKLRRTVRAHTEGQVIIGWGGSISHVDSFYYSGIIEALEQLMAEKPEVHFKFCGHERRLDWLLERLPAKQFIRHGGVSPEDWPRVVATFDVGVAPLDMRVREDGTGAGNEGYSYDERRSWLKLVEYLCGGVPFVATDSATYGELGRFGKLVENTPEAWYEGLKSRVEGLASFKEQAIKDRAWALKRLTAEANASRLIDFYDMIAADVQNRRNEAKLPDVEYVQAA